MAGLIGGGSGRFAMPSALSDILPTAGDVFGANAQDIFSAGQQVVERAALTTTRRALQTEIDRLSGFKTNLMPADRDRLARLQADIQKIESERGSDGFTPDQVRERAEKLAEAYRIMGKDFVDAANPELQAIADQVDALLEPTLRGGQKQRLEQLRKLSGNLMEQLSERPESATTRRQLANVEGQIRKMLPPRSIASLSLEERRQYDELVERANAIAGTEYLIESKKRIRIDQLRQTMSQIAAQEAALGDPVQDAPSAAQVVRAYRG